MQATKNGLKSTLRTPGKTLLFLLILTVTAALLSVSCSVYGAVRGYLADCDDYFHTIAELEYIGEDYPNQAVYDEGFAAAVEENRDKLSALIQAEPVLAWEPASNELLISPELSRWDTFVPMSSTLETATPSPMGARPERSMTRSSRTTLARTRTRFQTAKAPSRPFTKNRSMRNRRFAR